MISLLNPKGMEKLRELCACEQPLFAFDYDGTLSKIEDHPGEAHLTKKIADQLTALSRRAHVAVISGRSVVDLKERLPEEIPFLVGNHGIEGTGTVSGTEEMQRHCHDLTALWAKYFDDHAAEIESHGAGEFERENKGLSFSLHYRNCADTAKAKQTLLKYIYQLNPLPRVVLGKAVLNLIPQGSPHKGMALLNLMRKLQVDRALYVGDDETDEDVFHLHDDRLLTIRIGKKKTSHAQCYLKNQSEIGSLLNFLLECSTPTSDLDEGRNAKKSVGV